MCDARESLRATHVLPTVGRAAPFGDRREERFDKPDAFLADDAQHVAQHGFRVLIERAREPAHLVRLIPSDVWRRRVASGRNRPHA